MGTFPKVKDKVYKIGARKIKALKAGIAESHKKQWNVIEKIIKRKNQGKIETMQY